MLKTETITINETEYCHHYSDKNKMLRKVGTDEYYAEAIDIVPCAFEYEETDKEIGEVTDEI